MNRAVASILTLAACAASGCVGPRPTESAGVRRSDVLTLGDHFDCAFGSLFVIHIQDEYRLIRCVDRGSGAISGCYDDVLVVPTDEVQWNRWIEVPKAQGLDVAIVSPKEVAFRVRGGAGAAR